VNEDESNEENIYGEKKKIKNNDKKENDKLI
jgi:hypothetical protein